MIDRLRREIEDVHAFIAAWFRGDMARDDALFDARLARHLEPGLVNIQPSGRILTRAELLDGIHDGHARNPSFQIEIRDAVLRQVAGDTALVTYVEHQRGAKNTEPADNRRISSVWFCRIGGDTAPVWLHIHETGLE